MGTCTPQRVDHLDFNKSPLHQSIGRLLRDEDNDLIYIIYCSRQADATNKTGLYCRSFTPSTLTLGSVNAIAEDNTGSGRLTDTLKENYWPFACRLDNGTMIVAYQGNTAATRGMYIRESTDNGVTWSAEHELYHTSNPTAWDFGTIRELVSDGTNVFMLSIWTSGNGGGDLYLRKRKKVADWDNPIKIWDNPYAGDDTGWAFGATVNQKSASPTKAMVVKDNGDSTWSIAIVGHLSSATDATYYIKCLEIQDYNNLTAGTWTERLIHDFTADGTKTRKTVLDRGEDDTLRVCYWNREDTYETKSNWWVMGCAYSEDWGQTWVDVGIPDAPNDLYYGTTNPTWNPLYDSTFGTDYNSGWNASTIIKSTSTPEYYYRFRSENDTLVGWSLQAFCDVEESDTVWKTFATTSPPGDVVFVDTYMIRIVGGIIDPGSTTLDLILLTIGGFPPPPEDEEVPFPTTHRIWRRGLIQYVRTNVPQRNNMAAAPIDRLDKPGSF